VAGAGRLGEADDLGTEVVHRDAGEAAGPGADQAARVRDRGRVLGGHQPGMLAIGGVAIAMAIAVAVAVAELAVRDDYRLAGFLEHGHGGSEAGVRAVHHDAQPVAFGHHIAAEPAQPAVHRRLGLHVAELVDPVVHQGEHGDAVRPGFRQPPQVALEEVTALAAEQDHGAPVAGGPLQVGCRRGHLGAGRGRTLADPRQLAAVIGVGLAGTEVAVRAQALGRVRPQHREIRHSGQVHRGHARGLGGPHRVGDGGRAHRRDQLMPGRQPGQEAPACVPVQVDPWHRPLPSAAAGCHPAIGFAAGYHAAIGRAAGRG
jgi:hypothetical protein